MIKYRIKQYDYWGKKFETDDLYTEEEVKAVARDLRQQGYGLEIFAISGSKTVKLVYSCPALNKSSKKT
jgi:hypothetical protein